MKEGEETEEGGVEELRNDSSLLLLLKESMMMMGGSGPARVLRPVTLSLELNWDEVSELSVTVVQTDRRDFISKQK